jgi:hypothetical protein
MAGASCIAGCLSITRVGYRQGYDRPIVSLYKACYRTLVWGGKDDTKKGKRRDLGPSDTKGGTKRRQLGPKD